MISKSPAILIVVTTPGNVSSISVISPSLITSVVSESPSLTPRRVVFEDTLFREKLPSELGVTRKDSTTPSSFFALKKKDASSRSPVGSVGIKVSPVGKSMIVDNVVISSSDNTRLMILTSSILPRHLFSIPSLSPPRPMYKAPVGLILAGMVPDVCLLGSAST